jgi:serine phosphatase RsbU (regulator of sigma subunit)
MGQAYRKKNDYQNAEKFSNQALTIFKEINDPTSIAQVYNSLGLFRYELGQYDKAIEFYELSLKYRMISGDKKSTAIMYNNMGNVSYKWGDYEKALLNYQNALKIFEEINFEAGIGSCLNNIGLIYENSVRGDKYDQNVSNYNKALEYYEKALTIWEKLQNEREIANSYNNIGNIHTKNYSDKYTSKYGFYWEDSINDKDRGEFTIAIEYHKKALKLREKMDDKTKIVGSLQNIGKNYSITRNFDLGLVYQEKALKLYNQQGIENSDIYTGIGRIHHRKGNYQSALEYLKKGLTLSIKNKTNQSTKNTYAMLSNVYASMGDYKQSLDSYKKFAELQDLLVNESNAKTLNELQTKYETAEQQKKIESLNNKAKLDKAKFVQTFIFFSAILILVLVVIIFQVRQNRERKKTNKQLEAKNHLITEQKKEITDSIQYASRIQKAVMTVETQLKQILPNSFIFFRPRDIVSGDFFWVHEKNNKIIVVAADCTGHGVPGAFMSMLGMSMFKNIVAELDDLHADLILNELRKNIIDALHQTGKEGENKDGMDLALYIIDPQTQSVEYAGANNPLYIVRDGNLLETKADRMPIGIHEKSFEPFTRHNIPIQKGDMIYTFSDGYHDQFGGNGDKKFMSGNLKKLFVKIYNEPVEKQHQILEDTITDWMKNTHQIDDQLIIGVRI